MNEKETDREASAKATIERLLKTIAIQRIAAHTPLELFSEKDHIVAHLTLMDGNEPVDLFTIKGDPEGKVVMADTLALGLDCFEIGLNHGLTRDQRRQIRKIMKRKSTFF